MGTDLALADRAQSPERHRAARRRWAEAKRFGAETSGQTLLYDERGTLAFSGGITGSRGHAGDNAGRASLLALINRSDADRRGSSVFGCPLFSAGNGS